MRGENKTKPTLLQTDRRTDGQTEPGGFLRCLSYISCVSHTFGGVGVEGLRWSQVQHPAPSAGGRVQALEVTEDADVCELVPVAVGVQAEQEGPLQGDETPDARQVVASGISQGWERKGNG